jgi:Flp pilus assembly pilin Flp
MLKDKKGQGMVEYILIIVLIVIIALVGVKMFGGKLNSIFEDTSTKIGTEANTGLNAK